MRAKEASKQALGTAVLVGGLLTAPLTALLYVTNLLALQPFLAFDLLAWLLGSASDKPLARAMAVIVFVLLGAVAAALFVAALQRYAIRPRRRVGLALGTLFGLPLLFVSLAATAMGRPMTPSLLALLWLLLPYWLWGLAFIWAYRHLVYRDEATVVNLGEQAARRRFLVGLGATSAVVTLGSTYAGTLLARTRALQRRLEEAAAAMLPDKLRVRVYLADPAAVRLPEMSRERYRPDTRPFGVCFSGGGPRSCSATVGQLRGLRALGLLDSIGAISAVSGGAIASTIFSYAPGHLDDETLLGPVRQPEEITLVNLAELDDRNIGVAFLHTTNANMASVKAQMSLSASFSLLKSADRIFARSLNQIILEPFDLGDPYRFFTLDGEAVSELSTLNPGLSASNFYTLRPNRPYFIAGATHVYPLGTNQIMRHFEYTPLYVGTPQHFPGAGPDGTDFGGGYVQSLGFDSDAPGPSDAGSVVIIPRPPLPFLLSDVAASTGAAIGILLNRIEKPDWLPVFKYWSPLQAGQTPSLRQSFTDGGALENVGIVPLLRRQYPVILAFVNGYLPLGVSHPFSVEGIDGQISELFGLAPEQSVGGIRGNVHIFPTEKFAALAQGLKAAEERGTSAYFTDSYSIVQPNPFDLARYPDGREVTVVWFYNNLNRRWQERLSAPVRELFSAENPGNNLQNFPYYSTFNQNRNAHGVPELFALTPQQVNLIGHMWSYSLLQDAAEDLLSLRDQFT